MKNLKRALAVLVVVTMMISSVAFASSFSDVKDGTSVANAVNVGVGLNLFKGYDENGVVTFKPEGDITRAEFAAIVVRMLGQEAQAAGAASATSFTDVKADNWAAGYINIVTRLGIVNGYGDGTFGPEDKVLYEQAIKMIVVALGYTPAIGSAGYPVGYLTKAGELGITSGVAGSNGVAANRGTVAQLVFNSLDVPMMVQTGYGTNLNYVAQDGVGTDAVRKTFMSEYLDVVKLQATVKNITKTDNEITITVNKNYKLAKTAFAGLFNEGADKTILAGTSGIDQMIGEKVITYVKCPNTDSLDEAVVVFATKDTTSVDEVTVKSDEVENAIIPAGSTTRIEATYRLNPTDKTADKVILVGYDSTATNKEAKPTIYVNGEDKTSALSLTQIATKIYDSSSTVKAAGFYGEVRFAKNNDSSVGDYDTIYVTDYDNIVVDVVNVNNGTVTAKNDGGYTIVFDPTKSTTYKSTLYDTKGVLMAWKDLKEGDLVSVLKSTQAGKTVVNATLVNNSVAGKILQVEDQYSNKAIFTIDGKEYKIDADSLGGNSKFTTGDEGKFYLDALGRIAWYDLTVGAGSSNYAFVINGNVTSDIDNKSELKVFTAKGEIVTYKTASTVKLDGVSVASKDVYSDSAAQAVAKTAVSENLSVDRLIKEHGKDYFYKDATAKIAANTDDIAYISKVTLNDFITIEVNSNNEITTIDRPYTGANGKTTTDIKFATYEAPTVATYSASSNRLSTASGSVNLTDSTVVMKVKDTTFDANNKKVIADDSDFELFNVKSIVDDQQFTTPTFYNVNDTKNVSAVLVKTDINVTSSTDGFAAVRSVSKGINANGETVYNVNSLRNGEEKVLTSVDENSITSGNTPTNFVAGQVFLPEFTPAGFVKAYKALASVTTGGTISLTDNVKTSVPAKVKYYVGDVKAISGRTIDLQTGLVDAKVVLGGTQTVKTLAKVYSSTPDNNGTLVTSSVAAKDITALSSTKVYIYDARTGGSASNKMQIGNLSDISIKEATRDIKGADGITVTTKTGETYYDATGDAITNVVVFAREYDGDVTDIILYVFN